MFKPINAKGTATPRPCGDGLHHAGGAARWFVAIIDRPILNKWNVPLAVCTPCKNRLEEEWADALGREMEKAA